MKKGKGKQLIGILMLILACSVMTYGCNELPEPTEEMTAEIENTEDSSEEDTIVIDEQYLIENCGVTKEELEGVDVADFVEHYSLTPENIVDENIPSTLRVYKKYMEYLEIEENKKDDYAGIFEVENSGGYKDEYQEEITVIAIHESVGTYHETVIFDLEKKVYYFGEAIDVSDDYSQATKAGELTDEDVSKIRELIGEAGISEWKGQNGSLNPDENDYNTFFLTICSSDGTMYGYSGYEFPKGFGTLYSSLKKLKEL